MLHSTESLFSKKTAGWIPGLTPDPKKLKCIADFDKVTDNAEIQLEAEKSYYLECIVYPQNNGRVGISLSGMETPCVFELNSKRQKVQISEADSLEEFSNGIKGI